MQYYRFKVKFYEQDGEPVTETGIVAADTFGMATAKVAAAFVDEEDVESIKVKAIYPADGSDVMIVSKELLDAIEKEVIW